MAKANLKASKIQSSRITPGKASSGKISFRRKRLKALAIIKSLSD